MTISVTLRTPDGAPVLQGQTLELIGDDRTLSTATVDERGRVEFQASAEGVRRLAVRFPPVP